MERLRSTANEFDELAEGIPASQIHRCAALVTGVHDITAAIIDAATKSSAANVGGVAKQSTEDILTMWANELECANRNALTARTAQGYKTLLKTLVNLLEGHAKTLRWNLEHLPHTLSMEALVSYGAHHLPMWDKALSAACELAGVPRKTSDTDMYFACRCAAGMETRRMDEVFDEGFDPDTVDLNESDEEW